LKFAPRSCVCFCLVSCLFGKLLLVLASTVIFLFRDPRDHILLSHDLGSRADTHSLTHSLSCVFHVCMRACVHIYIYIYIRKFVQ
jgi:hypothetical protein